MALDPGGGRRCLEILLFEALEAKRPGNCLGLLNHSIVTHELSAEETTMYWIERDSEKVPAERTIHDGDGNIRTRAYFEGISRLPVRFQT